MRIHAILVLAVTALAAAGCSSTMKDVYAAKTEGRSAVYPVPVARAFEITGDIFWEATRAYPEEHRDHDFVCVRGGMGTDETLVGVWIEPVENAGRSRVTVVVRRGNGLQVSTKITEEEFHEMFARAAGVKRLP